MKNSELKIPSSIFELVKMDLETQIKVVRQGLPSKFVTQVSKVLAMPSTQLLELVRIPSMPLLSNRKQMKLLCVYEGDVILRVAKVLIFAEVVFESRDAAVSWLKRSLRSLGGVQPLSLLDTHSGFELVHKTLKCIEYGIPS